MDWENLRFFVAVARAGSMAGAGRALGVAHTTVMRRVAALERDLGTRLFARHTAGLEPTAAGRELLDAVEPLADEVLAAERRLAGLDQRLTGTVRVSSIGPLVPWVCEALADLRRDNPEVRAELLISPLPVSIARREADVALRVTSAPQESLVGRRLADLAHAVYAAPGTVVEAGPVVLAAQPWLTYVEARANLPQARWVAEHVPAEQVVLRTNHTASLVEATAAGMGLAVLPCYLGDRHPGLRRLAPLPDFGLQLWLLTHQDLRRSRRVRVLMDCIGDRIARHRDLIEGRG